MTEVSILWQPALPLHLDALRPTLRGLQSSCMAHTPSCTLPHNPSLVQVRDNWAVMGLTPRQGVALAARPHSASLLRLQGLSGGWSSQPERVSNDFFKVGGNPWLQGDGTAGRVPAGYALARMGNVSVSELGLRTRGPVGLWTVDHQQGLGGRHCIVRRADTGAYHAMDAWGARVCLWVCKCVTLGAGFLGAIKEPRPVDLTCLIQCPGAQPCCTRPPLPFRPVPVLAVNLAWAPDQRPTCAYCPRPCHPLAPPRCC